MTDHLANHIRDLTAAEHWMWTADTGLLTSLESGVVAAGAQGVPAAALAEVIAGVVHPADRGFVLHEVRDGLRRPEGYDITHRRLAEGSAIRTVRSRGRGVVAPSGELLAAYGSVQDVTQVAAMAAEVSRARDLFGSELDQAALRSIIGLDLHGRVTLFDSGAEQLLGLSAAEMMGAEVPPEVYDTAEVAARAAELGVAVGFLAIVGAAVRGEPETRQWTYITRTGRRLQVRVTVSATRDRHGVLSGYIQSGVDITERLDRRRAVHASEALFEEMFDHVANGIMLVDALKPERARIVRANPALCRISGYTEQQLLTMQVADLVSPDQRRDATAAIARLTHGRSVSEETERLWIHATGREVWVHLTANPVRHADSGLTMVTVQDITARRGAERRMHHHAMHDQLTGLPNRYLFTDRLDHALRSRTRRGSQVALLYIDLDGFKAVNDTQGHRAGDQVLTAAAQRLSRGLRSGDTVARIGGDEFVVLCPDLTSIAVAEQLAQRLLDDLMQPYPTVDGIASVSASVGVVVSTDDSTVRALVDQADEAMYAAKRAGKNRFSTFVKTADDPR